MPLLSQSALLVDPDDGARLTVARVLGRLGFDVHAHTLAREARAALRRGRFGLIVADLELLLADDARLLGEAGHAQPGVPIVALTGAGSLAECVRVLRAGAADCLSKPVRAQELEAAVAKALAASPRHAPRQRAVPEPAPAPAWAPLFVAGARSMREIVRTVLAATQEGASVLVSGERGTGKDALARLVHDVSGRPGGPLVSVDCGALPEGLVERELVGGGRGGALARAAGGTLVLDDVGALPPAAQERLARALGEDAGAHDVRLVALARGDLELAVLGGRFRADLLGRLGEVRVLLPPLRERREDIVLLAQHFLGASARRHRRSLELARETLAALRHHDWPLNVRELEYTVDRLAALATTPRLGLELLPPRFLRPGEPAAELQAPARLDEATPRRN